MYITVFTGGLIIVYQPFQMQSRLVINDLIWYFIAVLWIQMGVWEEKIYGWEAVGCFVLYGLYLICTFIVERYDRKSFEKERDAFQAQITETIELEKSEWRTLDEETENTGILTRFFNTFKDFWWHTEVRMNIKWMESSRRRRFFMVMMTPARFFIMLLIPTVDYQLPRNGWCKISIICNILILPSMFVWLTDNHDYWYWSAGASAAVALIVIFKSNFSKKPKYYEGVVLFSLIWSLLLIMKLTEHLRTFLSVVLESLYISALTTSLIAVTLVYGVSTHVCILTLAMSGYHQCGFAGTMGIETFNILIKAGIIFLMPFVNKTTGIKARQGTMGLTSAIFVTMFLILQLFNVVIMRFQARRMLGVFMLCFSAVYVIMFALVETGVIHPFGTDHFDEALV